MAQSASKRILNTYHRGTALRVSQMKRFVQGDTQSMPSCKSGHCVTEELCRKGLARPITQRV